MSRIHNTLALSGHTGRAKTEIHTGQLPPPPLVVPLRGCGPALWMSCQAQEGEGDRRHIVTQEWKRTQMGAGPDKCFLTPRDIRPGVCLR